MPRRICSHVLVLTLAVALLGSVDRAPAAPGKGFFGVVPQDALKPSDHRKMHRAGVGTLRLWLPWSSADPVPPVGDYDFSAFDRAVAAAAKQKIRVMPFVWGSPGWAIRKLDDTRCGAKCLTYAPRHKRALEAWRGFLEAAARRYGPGGSFWHEHRRLPKEPIIDWQIWNEQNSRTFLRPTNKPRSYARLLRASARAIHRVDRRAEIILGGMAELSGSNQAVPGSKYLAGLYRVRGIEHSFDSAAAHPYAAKAENALDQVRDFRQVMDRAGDRHGGLWITEAGWSSSSGPNPLEVGPRGQAQRLRQSMGRYRARRGALNLHGVLWYSWRDTATAVCAWCAHSGLLTQGGRPKPAFRAFRDVAR
jgi:hypothetical protein